MRKEKLGKELNRIEQSPLPLRSLDSPSNKAYELLLKAPLPYANAGEIFLLNCSKLKHANAGMRVTHLLLSLFLLPATLLSQRVEYHHLGEVYSVDGSRNGILYKWDGNNMVRLPTGGEFRIIPGDEGIDLTKFYPLDFYPIVEKVKRPLPFEGQPERVWEFAENDFAPTRDGSMVVSDVYGEYIAEEAVGLILWIIDGKVSNAHRVSLYEHSDDFYRLTARIPLSETDRKGFPVFALAKHSTLLARQGTVIPKAILAAAIGSLEQLRELNDADLNRLDLAGNTALHRAALNGHVDVVKYLLERGLKPSTKNMHGQVPTMLAASASRLEVLKVLAEADPSSLNKFDEITQSTLYHATMSGSLEVLNYLLTTHHRRVRVHIDKPNNFGWSPVDWALNTNNDAVYSLLRDANRKSIHLDRRITTLEATLWHIALDGALEIAKDLIKAGTDLKGERSRPYLVAAASGGTRDIVDLLLKAGISINQKGGGGATPLIAAAHANRTDAVRYLIQKGAKLDTETEMGVTALMSAVYMNNTEIVRELLNAGASIGEGSQASMQLVTALEHENSEIIEMLINAGVMNEVTADYIDTILEKSIRADVSLVVEKALETLIEPNHKLYGKYPLRWTMEHFNASDCLKKFTALPTEEIPELSLSEPTEKAPSRISAHLPYPTSVSLQSYTDFTIEVKMVIDEEGRVRLPHIIKSPFPETDLQVLNSISEWRFEPAHRGGVRVPVRALQSLKIEAPIGKYLVAGEASIETPPEVIHWVAPVYPPQLGRLRFRGNVVVQIVVDENGDVRSPVIINSPHHLFSYATLFAAQQWKFKPALINGIPTNTVTRINFLFEIPYR